MEKIGGAKDSEVIAVKVAARVRPLVERELNSGALMTVKTHESTNSNRNQFTRSSGRVQDYSGSSRLVEEENSTVPCDLEIGGRTFTFDFVFGPQASQEECYDAAAAPIISKLFSGYNATIFAYGQTGSGKTHTMGTDETTKTIVKDTGIIPRIAAAIFKNCSELESDVNKFAIKCSMLEIYEEKVLDLLGDGAEKEPLSIRESGDGVFVQGLRQINIESMTQAMDELRRGGNARSKGVTAMNSRSSRSHAVFTLYLHKTSTEDETNSVNAKFHLVDLAGSERLKKTQASGVRLKEGIKINEGLSALGNVINALTDTNDKRNFVPYRDSKLTRLLQDSLGGNSYTVMIACVSPADSSQGETLSSLKYAERAKKIKNKPTVNQDPAAAELQRLRTENRELQMKLLEMMGGNISEFTAAAHTSKSIVLPSPASKKMDAKDKQALESEIASLKCKLERETTETKDLFITNAALQASLAEQECERDGLADKLASVQQIVDTVLSEAAADETQTNTDDENVDGNNENGTVQHRRHLELWRNVKGILDDDKTMMGGSVISQSLMMAVEEEYGLNNQNRHNESRKRKNSGSESREDNDESQTDDSSVDADFEQGGDKMNNGSFGQDGNLGHSAHDHATRQNILSQQLQDLVKRIGDKQKALTENAMSADQFKAVQHQHEKETTQLNSQIDELMKQKNELQQQLRRKDISSKLAEERRRKVADLEKSIQDYRRRLIEKQKLDKLNQKQADMLSKYQTEIQDLKKLRVRLVKQLKSESENWRKNQLKTERELNTMKQKDRRRDVEATKTRVKFEAQILVLQRKYEESASTSKRLQAQLLRNQHNSANRKPVVNERELRTFIEDQLDFVATAEQAKLDLESLSKQRADLMGQLKQEERELKHILPPKKKSRSSADNHEGEGDGDDENDENDDGDEDRSQLQARIERIRLQIAKCSHQMDQLGHQIVEIDENDNKRDANRWSHITSLPHAVSALKELFTIASAVKIDYLMECKGREEAELKTDELAGQMKEMERKVTAVQAEMIEKTALLKCDLEKRDCEYLKEMNYWARLKLPDDESCERLEYHLKKQDATIGEMENQIQNIQADLKQRGQWNGVGGGIGAGKGRKTYFKQPLTAGNDLRRPYRTKNSHRLSKQPVPFGATVNSGTLFPASPGDSDYQETPVKKTTRRTRPQVLKEEEGNEHINKDDKECSSSGAESSSGSNVNPFKGLGAEKGENDGQEEAGKDVVETMDSSDCYDENNSSDNNNIQNSTFVVFNDDRESDESARAKNNRASSSASSSKGCRSGPVAKKASDVGKKSGNGVTKKSSFKSSASATGGGLRKYKTTTSLLRTSSIAKDDSKSALRSPKIRKQAEGGGRFFKSPL